jgi:hypothetical protein
LQYLKPREENPIPEQILEELAKGFVKRQQVITEALKARRGG